jgi:hypothetical protein
MELRRAAAYAVQALMCLAARPIPPVPRPFSVTGRRHPGRASVGRQSAQCPA